MSTQSIVKCVSLLACWSDLPRPLLSSPNRILFGFPNLRYIEPGFFSSFQNLTFVCVSDLWTQLFRLHSSSVCPCLSLSLILQKCLRLSLTMCYALNRWNVTGFDLGQDFPTHHWKSHPAQLK